MVMVRSALSVSMNSICSCCECVKMRILCSILSIRTIETSVIKTWTV